MDCPDLSLLTEEHEKYKYYYNFLALLAIILGNNDFILKEMGISLKYVKRKGKIDESHNGITFVGRDSGGHFHFKSKDGRVTDSYKEGWQIPQTNGFCQTFAIMGFKGKTNELKNKKYLDNTIKVLKFIKTISRSIEKYWKNTVLLNYNTVAFDYPDLNSKEIKEDIDCLIQNEYFLQGWLTNETVFN